MPERYEPCPDSAVYAWVEYRKEYGVLGADMTQAHKAFMAGWAAAHGHMEDGPLR